MGEQMITTPCPSCGGKTLFVGSGGHLTCSWLECKEPVVRIAIEQLKADNTEAWVSLVEANKLLYIAAEKLRKKYVQDQTTTLKELKDTYLPNRDLDELRCGKND